MSISTPVPIVAVLDTAPAADHIVIPGVTFIAGRLYLLEFYVDRATAPDLGAASTSFEHNVGNDRTSDWHIIAQQSLSSARNMAVYQYQATVTETVDLHVHFPGAIGNSYGYTITEVPAGFNAAAPILQSNSASAAGVNNVSVTLGATPTTGNLCMAFVVTRAASGALTARTNWTELSEALGTGTAGLSGAVEVQYVFDPNLEATASANASGTRTWGIIAIEIAAASGGGTAQTLTPNGTTAAGGWTDQAGAALDLHTPLADESSTTWIQTPSSPDPSQVAKIALSNPTAAPGPGDIIIEIDAEQI